LNNRHAGWNVPVGGLTARRVGKKNAAEYIKKDMSVRRARFGLRLHWVNVMRTAELKRSNASECTETRTGCDRSKGEPAIHLPPVALWGRRKALADAESHAQTGLAPPALNLGLPLKLDRLAAADST
jgi:hypothetical protein